MDDVLGRTFSYFLLVIAFFFIVPLLIFANADISNRSYVGQAVAEFTDQARESGTITHDNYHRLMNKLTATGETYIVSIEHKSKVSVIDENGKLVTSFKSFNYNDIMNYMSSTEEDEDGNITAENRDYPMKSGDYLSVTVKSQNATIGSRFFSGIFSQQPGIKLICTSGGLVGGNS